MIDVSNSALSPQTAAAVRRLASAAAAVDGVEPLSEATLLRLSAAGEPVHHLLARDEPGDDTGEVLGYAQLDETATAELVVVPHARRQGIATRLLDELAGIPAQAPLQVWAHGDHAAAAALARRRGLSRTRVLLQLRRPLSADLPEPRWPANVSLRTFVPGRDEAAWLAVNAAAFASHPEQGRWTARDLAQREAQDWFDPNGFFLAERAGELVGFHWTKIHTDVTPAIGEVYVVGVRPQDSGRGLGPALTLAGLHYLRSRGLTDVMLYVDESNVPAVKTYERLGFTRWAVDVCYRLAGAQ